MSFNFQKIKILTHVMETTTEKQTKPKRRYIKKVKPKPIIETKERTTKPINLVTFSF